MLSISGESAANTRVATSGRRRAYSEYPFVNARSRTCALHLQVRCTNLAARTMVTPVPARGRLRWYSVLLVWALLVRSCSQLREGAIGEHRPGDGFEVEVFSARTVDEALADASAKLGLPARELAYDLRDPGASGFLGSWVLVPGQRP